MMNIRPAVAFVFLSVSHMALAEPVSDAPAALWPDVPPGGAPVVAEGSDPHGRMKDAERMTDVAVPTLTRYRPEKPDGRALIVCPGGGYGILAVEREGAAVARRFAKDGLTVFVLHYRVPSKDAETSPDSAPRRDLARALEKVRETLSGEGFAKPRVGVLGFSAGGHLVLESAYGRMSEGSVRPDFVVAVYAAYLTEKSGALKSEFLPRKGSPPACLISTAQDAFPTDPDYELWKKLRAVGSPSEIHLFAKGTHGFGVSSRTGDLPVAKWPDVAETWIRSQE